MTIRGVFVNATERREIGRGETLFVAGDPGHHMFGVFAGQFELRRGDDVLAVVGPGETFGEMAIIDGSPRNLTAVAVEPSEVAVIDRGTFLFLVHETPMFALQVMQSLASRIRDLDSRI
jgi:CRP/FNR family transcriptional regulator, cyclic AMP receptor protein